MALQISRTELKNGVERQVNGEAKKITGVERLTEELDKIYMEDVEKERYQAYADFRSFNRGSSMSIHEYLLEFDKRVKMLKEYKIELPESVLAYELLNSARGGGTSSNLGGPLLNFHLQSSLDGASCHLARTHSQVHFGLAIQWQAYN